MKKINGIWIDYSNKEQVAWWNDIASKLVTVKYYNEVAETATGKPVGVMIALGGVFKNWVIKENHKFIKNPVTAVFDRPL